MAHYQKLRRMQPKFNADKADNHSSIASYLTIYEMATSNNERKSHHTFDVHFENRKNKSYSECEYASDEIAHY
jgi:hypothetical protein